MLIAGQVCLQTQIGSRRATHVLSKAWKKVMNTPQHLNRFGERVPDELRLLAPFI